MSQYLPSWVARSLVAIACGGLLASSWGCQATIPTPPHGVLSTIHQKTLGLAAQRAMQQAGVASDFSRDRVFLTVKKIADTDLGKQHAARVAGDSCRRPRHSA